MSPHSAMLERMYDLLEGLNEEQRAVAAFDGGPLRVLAGAGTGKTTALSSRVARIVADGIPAERVLLLTFTRRAARQMVERSHARLARAGHRSGRVSGGTFHLWPIARCVSMPHGSACPRASRCSTPPTLPM